MKSHTTQLHNITPEEFKNELLVGINEIIRKHLKSENTEQLLTRKQVAQYLSISLPTLRAYVKRGLIKEERIGSRVLYKKSDLPLGSNS